MTIPFCPRRRSDAQRQSVRSRLLSTLLAVGAAAICASDVRALETLFHVSFDDTVDAVAAKGDPKGKFAPPRDATDKTPQFADGIRGRALDIGLGAQVAYSSEGNVLDERGTITFWARRTGPKPEGRYTFRLGGWSNRDGAWVYLYRWEWYVGVHMLHGRGGSGDIGLGLPGDGDDGEWHFFAFTWDGTKAKGYIDGKSESRSERLDFPAQQFRNFWVGGGGKTSRLIDEFKIFNEPLSVSEIKSMHRELAGVRNRPALIVPRRRETIAIDGKISAEEWAGAVETTGFVGIDSKLAAPTQTRVRLLYDDTALYLAFASLLPEEARDNPAMTTGMTGALMQTRSSFDTDVDGDDAIEIDLMPEPPEGMWYRLVVNGLNTHYDYSVAPDGNITLDWNPTWESAATLDAEAWRVEVRLPFAGLGVEAPQPGSRWGLNLIRIWQALQSGREAWMVAPGARPGYRYATAPVRFGAAADPVVQLTDWGPVADNSVAVRGRILNPGDKPLQLSVELTSDSDEIRHAEDMVVDPGGAAALSVDGRVQDPATSLLTLEIATPDGKEPLFRSQIPVTVRQVLEINTAHFPSAGVLKTMVDAGRLRGTPLADLALTVTLLDAQGKAALPPKRAQPLPGYRCDVEVDVKPLPPGKYQAHCRIEAKGKTAAEQTIPYEKLPAPEWYGNTIGVTDKAPKPFTPVRRQDAAIHCWGREYRYAERLFPVQIVTQGSEILAAPIELVLTDASGQRLSSADVPATGSWGRHTDFRVEFERACRLGDLTVSASCWLECDGFLWTVLRVAPTTRTVGKLVVRVPLNQEWSEYINPYDYSTARTGRLKPDGFEAGDAPLWLGGPVGGLQWTTETLADCRLSEGASAVRVSRGQDRNLFELTLVDAPTTLEHGLEVAWGWVATPVRPPTPGCRGWLTRNCDLYPGYQWYWPKGTDFDPRWLDYHHFIGSKERPDGKGKYTISSGPYVVTGMCSLKVPEFKYWGDEWSPSRTGRRTQGASGLCSVAARSWIDFFVWCYRRTYDRGRYIGLYYDCAPYYPDDNLHHGAGCRKDGKLLPVKPVLAAREMAKRMYCMLRELEPDRTMVLYHNSGQIDMAFLAWCDVYVDGENFTSKLRKTEPDYHRIYPPDAFLAQSMGHNFGPSVWFLDEFTRSRAVSKEDWKRLGTQPCDHLYGLILLHDSGYWKAYGIGYERIDAALRKYAFDDRYRMIPYWNQKVVTLPDKVFATFYRDPGAGVVLLVLLNNNDNDLALRLKLDWTALGFEDWRRVAVDDAVFHGEVKIENAELHTPVGKANMRLLALTRK